MLIIHFYKRYKNVKGKALYSYIHKGMFTTQAHEQNNLMIKTDARTTNVLTNALVLISLTITFTDFDKEDQFKSDLLSHHEDKASF